jgi:hypothetical protein
MLGLLVLFMLAPILVGLANGDEIKRDTNIHIHNTHAVGVLLETKCDFNYKTQSYKFYKRIFVPKKDDRTISVPYGLKECEIWVIKVVFW